MSDILVKEYRGDVLENIHRGSICIVDDQGRVRYSHGNPDAITFYRSAAKPIQAIPAFRRGVDVAFHLTPIESTLLAASHRGEHFHVEALQTLAKKIECTEQDLLCMPTYPLNPDAKTELIWMNQPARRLYHNCSGKHFGMMALAKLLAVSTENYWERSHPVQKEILQYLSLLSDYPMDKINCGVDGCGVPVYALPLKHMAISYVRLACPDLMEDAELEAAIRKVCQLMNDHHLMIGGSKQICSTLLQDRNIVAKGGAKGVYCIGLKEERLGISLKIEDGSEESWPLIVAGILEQIHYENKETIERMYDLATRFVVNDNQKIVGENKLSFTLKQVF
ncbi:asparaginase [Neobacillus rhizosphaerae]|uniref:asparaginase n=1 Tax=Neobacillus rhizosphaerae TaxID=2880965 RepID=UPI003D2CB00E